MFGRQKAASIVAEFLGTGILTLVYLSVQRSSIGIAYFIAIAAGAAVVIASYFFGESSGAHLNPAITLGLWTARKMSTLVAAVYIVAQLLGGWAAYGIFRYLVGSSFAPIGGHYSAKVLFAEAVGTFIFALAWGAAFFRRSDATNRALMLGGAYAIAILVAASVHVGGSAPFGLANPAVAVGTRAWAVFGTMGWGTYVLGPVLGAIIGVNLYTLLFAPANVVGAGLNESVVVAETTTPVLATSAKSRRDSKTIVKKGAVKKTTAKKSTSNRRRR